MLNSLRSLFVMLTVAAMAAGCGALGDSMADAGEITKAIEASSPCRVSKSEVKIHNGEKSAMVEIKDCEVTDAVAEADRLNDKLLATVSSYKKLDRFTFVLVNVGMLQSIEYEKGKRAKN